MEEGQRLQNTNNKNAKLCLNPCCNGRGSKTPSYKRHRKEKIPVLILVVMEEGQRRSYYSINNKINSLNPCCNGRGSKTDRREPQKVRVVKS